MGFSARKHDLIRPLDPGQYRLWHRIRRIPRFVFVVVLGGIVTAGLIVGLNVLVTWAVAGVTLGEHALLMVFGGVMLATWLSSAWTWSYMQRRYAATRNVRCPGCGYLTIGLHSARCPECGRALDER